VQDQSYKWQVELKGEMPSSSPETFYTKIKLYYYRIEVTKMDSSKLILWTITLLNTLAFILIGLDKYKSKHNRWRISEKTFFTIAALGGSLGVLVGMYFFRHKTRHISFVWGIPIILILQIAVIYYFYA
jgi:uncharacterized membrane protein YsdA (DUF1294 family)